MMTTAGQFKNLMFWGILSMFVCFGISTLRMPGKLSHGALKKIEAYEIKLNKEFRKNRIELLSIIRKRNKEDVTRDRLLNKNTERINSICAMLRAVEIKENPHLPSPRKNPFLLWN